MVSLPVRPTNVVLSKTTAPVLVLTLVTPLVPPPPPVVRQPGQSTKPVTGL